MSKRFLSYFGSSKVVDNQDEPSQKKSATEYAFSHSKLTKWKKSFIFWNTVNQVPTENIQKKISWLQVNERSYTCWVCNQFPNINNSENEVTKGMS